MLVPIGTRASQYPSQVHFMVLGQLEIICHRMIILKPYSDHSFSYLKKSLVAYYSLKISTDPLECFLKIHHNLAHNLISPTLNPASPYLILSPGDKILITFH